MRAAVQDHSFLRALEGEIRLDGDVRARNVRGLEVLALHLHEHRAGGIGVAGDVHLAAAGRELAGEIERVARLDVRLDLAVVQLEADLRHFSGEIAQLRGASDLRLGIVPVTAMFASPAPFTLASCGTKRPTGERSGTTSFALPSMPGAAPLRFASFTSPASVPPLLRSWRACRARFRRRVAHPASGFRR